MAAYEEALQQLSQAPLGEFVTERKRLAEELRAKGDAAAATQIVKRRRPSISVWVVNQLYWNARDAMDDMLAAAARLRNGDLRASGEYKDRVAKLRNRAADTLKKAGYGVSDATLRRVATTLAAIAAGGGFDPDPPGALSTDRDPPGFEAIGLATNPSESEPSTQPQRELHAKGARAREIPDTHGRHGREELDAARHRAVAERKRLEAAEAQRRAAQQAERLRRESERHRLHTELRAATAKVGTRERARSLLEEQLRAVEKSLDDARATVENLQRKLAELDEEG